MPKILKNGRKQGEIFTQKTVVEYLLDEVGFIEYNNLGKISLLEPASGVGAFAIEITERMIKSSKKYKFDFLKAFNKNIRFVELNENSLILLKENVKNCIIKFGFDSNLIDDSVFVNSDFLTTQFNSKFDCVVGNPPYIRHENIDIESKKRYKELFKTFRYRADLYIPFYEKSLSLTKADGVLSFICSNRWLNNQYGKLLRELITERYHLSKVINMEKVSSFDEAVIAYPCITTITNNKANTTLCFETNNKEINFNDIRFNKTKSPLSSSWDNLFIDYDLGNNSLRDILSQGFEIGIGVATGADKIFIIKKNKPNSIEEKRLIPLIKSKALKGEFIEWDESYVINPFEDGKLCNLENYPQLKKYFLENSEKLQKRYIAKKNPHQWYKTIDKIKEDLTTTPKLLLPDLASSYFLFVDEGRFYPHHNLYYITGVTSENLKILSSILMSDFMKSQLSKIGIRMNGGLPRLQSQTLKKLKIPIIDEFDEKDREKLLLGYNMRNFFMINSIINRYCIEKGILI